MFAGLGTLFLWMDPNDTTYQWVGMLFFAGLAGASALDGWVGFCLGCWMFKLVGGFINVDPSAKCDTIQEEFKETKLWQRRRLNEGPSKLNIKYAPEKPEERRLPYVYKVKTDDQKKEDFDVIKHDSPQFFVIGLALAGLALCWKFYVQFGCPAATTTACPNHTDQQWEGLGVFAAVVFCALLLLYVVKFLLYPYKVAKDWDHPIRSNAFGLVPLNLLAFSFLLVDTKHDEVWERE